MKRLAEALDETLGKSLSTYNRTGCWAGRVEDINDPRRLNRLRVRIYQIHGDKRSTPTSALPWAELADAGGGGYDYGSAGQLYPVGSTVWVMFITGDERFPVVIGGRRGAPVRDEKNPIEFLTTDGQSYDGISAPWLPPEGNEMPKDVFDESADDDTFPTRSVWHKSYKGHTILVEDRDGAEFLKIIDRSGQVIELNCPVTPEENANNKQQRGSRNSSNDSQLPQSSLVGQRGFIRLKDVGGNEILLDGASNNERILIKSTNRQGASAQTIELSSAKGREKITVVDKQGNTLVIDPNNPAESIVLKDFAGNEISFNAEKGFITTKASTNEIHEVGGVSSTIGSDRTETIGGSEDTKIAGNKLLNVLGDLAASIAGMSSLVVGGAVQASISNMPISGVPATTALSIEILMGGFLVNSKVNADPMKISTLAGNIEFSTLAGMIKATTVAGTAEFGSETLQTTIKGPLGVLLGGPAAAFSIAYGEGVQAALTTIGTMAAADIRVCMGIPVPPTALAGLAGALAGLTAPGVMFSLFNKTA